MADVWVCGQCRSINKPGDQRCYSCKTPRAIAQVDPLAMPISRSGPVAMEPSGDYQSTTGLALLVSLLILVGVAISVSGTVFSLGIIDATRDAGNATDADVEAVRTAVLLTIGVALLAVLAWATWLSRVVANLPALGLGYGRISPRFVFVEGVIPFYNLYRMPAVVSDILRRIDPVPRDGIAIGAAWLPLVGSFVLTVLIWRASLFVESGQMRQIAELGREISVGFQIVAGLFLVALVWRVEGRVRRRAAELRG